MQTFNVQAHNLTEKDRRFFARELPTQDNIVAVMAFSEASVYSNSPKRLDGVLVITGPVVQTHVFTNVGLTRKYRGTMVQGEQLPRLGPDVSKYVIEHHPKLLNEFRDMCQNVHRAVSEFAKLQLEQKL